MLLNSSPTELTTAGTDAAMGLLCFIALSQLVRLHPHARWKRTLWSWVLALLGVASVLGAAGHGLEWAGAARAALWGPLYLLLGLSVTLFLVGGICDWRGEAVARRALPWAVGVGLAFLALVELLGGAFFIFVVFDTAAMLTALAMYGLLAATRRLVGAGLITLGIGLTIVAGAVQASRLSVRLFLPFDHNGLFHLTLTPVKPNTGRLGEGGVQPNLEAPGRGALLVNRRVKLTCGESRNDGILPPVQMGQCRSITNGGVGPFRPRSRRQSWRERMRLVAARTVQGQVP